MAEEAGGTVWQKPQWKDWGGMDGYSGYFLDPDGYHGKLHTHHF